MTTENKIRVWDPLVRLFHWTLVISFTIAYLTGEEDTLWHIYSGYTVLGLILIRIVWGMIGTKHARFADFVYRPSTVLTYSRDFIAGRPAHYLGHNPLGGLMVAVLLLALLASTFTGLMVYAYEEHAGPMAWAVEMGPGPGAIEMEEQEEFWEELHEVSTNTTLFLVILHILGVIAGSRVHHENLVKAMITGYKSTPEDNE